MLQRSRRQRISASPFGSLTHSRTHSQSLLLHSHTHPGTSHELTAQSQCHSQVCLWCNYTLDRVFLRTLCVFVYFCALFFTDVLRRELYGYSVLSAMQHAALGGPTRPAESSLWRSWWMVRARELIANLPRHTHVFDAEMLVATLPVGLNCGL